MPKFSMKDLLSENSKAAALTIETPPEAPETETGAASALPGFTRDIPIELIELSPSNKYGIRDVEELAASIEQMGLMHNLVVIPIEETGKYELISGERRLLALKLLEWQTAPCKVESGFESDTINELRLIHANATARVLNDYEKTMQAARLKELLQKLKDEGYKFKGRMREIVANILKVSPAQMGRMESIEKHLLPELKAEFEAENIGISAAYEASTMKPEEQAAAYEEYKTTGQLPSKPKKPIDDDDSEPEQKPKSWIHEHEERKEKTEEAIERMRAADALKAPTQEQYEQIAARGESGGNIGEYARATLESVDGNITAFTGKLAIVAAVGSGDNEFGGSISANANVTDIEYVTLATVVCEEILNNLENTASIDMMRQCIIKLFDEGF